MNNNQYYILKYNLKYALSDGSGFSESEKQHIRDAEKVSSSITKGYYAYAVTDFLWSVRSYKRHYGHNKFTYNKQIQKGILFMSIRLFVLYELAEYASMMYLVN